MHPSIAAAMAVVLAIASTQAAQKAPPPDTGPDGTKLACLFYFRLFVSDPAASDCGGYQVTLNRGSGPPSTLTLTVADEEIGDKHSYALSDLPLEEPVLLMATRDRQTRVIARRDSEIVMFFVGRDPFIAPPSKAVLPRTSQNATPAPPKGPAQGPPRR